MKNEQLNQKKKIVITHLPSDKVREEVFGIAKRSRALIEAICVFSKELKRKDIEVYERHVNIIRTEEGYYCAFFEDDIKKNREGSRKEEIVKPFKSIDGRMKVSLLDKNGETQVEDLALLVAKAWIPNPDKLENVGFKDGNMENCAAENLFWF